MENEITNAPLPETNRPPQESGGENRRRERTGRSNDRRGNRDHTNRPRPPQSGERAPHRERTPMPKEEGEELLNYSDLPPEDPTPAITTIAELQRMPIEQLTGVAKMFQIKNMGKMNKAQIVHLIVKAKMEHYKANMIAEGVLDLHHEGFGFLRSPFFNYISSAEDVHISQSQVRKNNLKRGDSVKGHIRIPKEGEQYFALASVLTVNDDDISSMNERIAFENLTPLFPDTRFFLETAKNKLTPRVLDLFIPLGKGQRALIVAPPKTGKTTMLQDIANAISQKYPECVLKILLIDERPEEVTDMIRNVKNAEVIASTFDEPASRHVKIADMVIDNAKRLVEHGKDVIILLDSITRLARAYNMVEPHSGKVLSGGVDANALHKPKRFFGAARNIEHGGSLTIIATALVDTGSRMDEVIFEEFKGTGNAEIVLTRELSNKRLYPAIDLLKSGTRKEELLYDPQELLKINLLRVTLADLGSYDAMNMLLRPLTASGSNVEFLLSLKG